MKNDDKFYLTIPLVHSIEKATDYSENYLVYGDGGFGKTTSMLMLFKCFLNKAQRGENIVPIYIDSKGLDFTYDKPVFEYIIREYCGLNKDISKHIETLNDLLKNSDKKYNIIIDAINEAESNKFKVIRDIASLKEIFDKNQAGRLIVSSRTDENVYCFNDFKRIKMLDFTDEQIVDFLNKYDFKNSGKSIDKIDIEKIDENLMKILRTPMFLNIFKDVYKDADVFPDLYTKNIIRESDLLSKFVEKIFKDKMDEHKAEKSPEYIKCYFALKRFLPALAFELAKNDAFSISNEKLHNLFINKFNEDYFCQFESLEEDYYENAGSLKRILKKCIEDFSFIVSKGEKNNAEYSFLHQVWRDYFAAVYLKNSIDYDVADGFEHQISDNIQQYVGEIVREYDFENKTDILSPMSPIEAFMQRNCNILSPLAVRLCIEIMKKSRNGKIIALYDNLDLKYINFHNYNFQGSSFNNSKVYEHNFLPQGHTGSVKSVCYSPDGKRIVSGSYDKTIRIWDAETGKQIGESLEGHTDCVNSVCYSPNGKRIVSGSEDTTIRIWDAETGKQIGEPLEGYAGVKSVCYSPNGKRIVSGNNDETIRIWDSKTGKQIGKSLEGHTGTVNSVCYSPDGKRIASGGSDETIRIWNAETGKQIGKPLVGHIGSVNSVCYSTDGKRIVSVDDDEIILIWDAKTGMDIELLTEHMSFVNSVSCSPDGKRIVSGSNDSKIRIWDLKTGNRIKLLDGHKYSVNSVCYSPDGKRLASGSSDNTIRIWNVETGKQIGEPLEGYIDFVESVSYSPNGKRIVSGGSDETIRIWDAEAGKQVRKPLEGHKRGISSVCYSPDGKRIVSGSWDETIRIWDAETGKQIGESLEGHIVEVNSVGYSPNGKRIVSGGCCDETIRIWDAETGKQIGEPLEGHAFGIISVSYSANGERIVSGSLDETIRIWNAETGKQIGEPLEGHMNFVKAVCYSSDGKRIVSGSCDKTIRIWDSKTGKQIGKPLEGHTGTVNSVCYSPDDKKIVSGSDDETIRIWDAEKRKQIGNALEGHTDDVNSVSFSPDGKRIVSGSRDETIRIWDLETHLCTVLKGIIQSNIQKCDFRNAIFNSEDINDFCHILYCNGADVPEEYEPKPIPFEWNDEELNDKESE